MQKNTVLLIGFLAVFAALVVGVNLGRLFSPPSQPIIDNPPQPSPPISLATYTNDRCGISLKYPNNFDYLEGPTLAFFTDPEASHAGTFSLICQKDLPKLFVNVSSTETIQIGSIAATLYHDVSEKSTEPIDKLIFYHPTKKLDVYLAGFGEIFDQIRASLQITE